MSVATSSHRAPLLRVLLLVLPIAQNLVRSQVTPAPSQTCHSFHCFGERCYQEAKFSSRTAKCRHGEHHCKLVQFNASHYMAGCSLSCEAGNETSFSPCLPSGNLSPSPCTLQCCSKGPLCLALNDESTSGLGHPTIAEDKLLPTPTLVATTLPAPKRNGKICATFSCQGSDCFEGQKAVAGCPEGLDFCELKQSSSGYTAGCSQACMAETPRCHGAVAQPCYQECCQASASSSCLQLDGNLHFNQAASGAARSSLHWDLAGVVLLFLHYALLLYLLP
ncbi:uncharacterized protein LOC119235799 [Talpa occidentalis]|uniref:uncharacterized protein LOC119235799 n=1 Tax=Talpa occidentalis TaxID=50954 RepID=UPI0023F8831F|nr:uncharacterized protein LOC119235799 [Talpa occidentalis]